MDTSSESDSYHRTRGREARRTPGRDGAGGGDGGAGDLSEKIGTLASTLQDTSRNLTKVDRMLGHYRAHTDGQAQAMALLRENLEESISQLQTQRGGRPGAARSASASTLHTSDLEACSGSEGQRFSPTSPLRDDSGPPGRRRRSQSASVRFKDAGLSADDIHALHQSLRDLHCDQHRLSDDLDREILRRNRSEIDTRRAMESLTDNTASHRHDSVSSRVERRLQELEREMHPEHDGVERERRPEHDGVERERRPEHDGVEREEAGVERERRPEHDGVERERRPEHDGVERERRPEHDGVERERRPEHDGLERERRPQETSGRHQEREEAAPSRQLRADTAKMEQELEGARRLHGQSEESREALVHQVEEMRVELLRLRKEKSDLQLQTCQPRGDHAFREEGRAAGSTDRLQLEVSELRARLHAASEVEELKKTLERKEKERLQLSFQVEDLSSDMARREQQQLMMLEQLREIQGRGQAERRETEVLLQESTRSREELRTRAQEAVRQWRAKCRRLQKELEEAQAQSDQASQAARDKQSSQAQLKALSQQSEASRRELAEVLGRLAQREEELHRKDVELSETRQRQLSLEQEIREVREASAALGEESHHLAAAQARLREENQRLEDRADAQARRCQTDQDAQAELRAALRQATSAHALLLQRSAEEERAKGKLLKAAAELQAQLAAAQEERAALGQQLQLERIVHQSELDSTRDRRTDTCCDLQERLALCQQERDDVMAHLEELKAAAASDRELCAALHLKLDRMKAECDKLAAQLSAKDEAHALSHRKYQLLKQELEDTVRSAERGRASESELLKLEQKVLRMDAEREAVLTSMGEELDAACRSLAKNGEDKLQAISQKPGLVKDLHRWLAETQTKIRWLCEEVRESTSREQRLKKQQQQTRDQLKALRQSRVSEQTALLQRLDQQEQLLHVLDAEKRELLERSRRKEEDMRSLQDRMLDLEMNTRVALDHLDSIPEKQCLMKNFQDLEESQQQRAALEQRHSRYQEIVWDLQHQLDESKRRIQEHRDEKLDAASRSLRLAALSSCVKASGAVLSGPLGSGPPSPRRRLSSSDLDEPPVHGPPPSSE
ncbi:centrosomal protein of 128 kDa-like [Pseudoliparis swirei]|uniref:centrosomal protein of 128 kDa-like n=1 Tax=Pseudoliparis swirei TaxID=2059687 RepID=UPI0024BE2E95|nr:centrosomal protein of 128 kDa-like [Pseudoliparis swirei]